MFRFCLPALLLLVIAPLPAVDSAAQQPVYIQLVLDLDDHLNFEMTMDRLDRTLALVERLRERYPGLEPVCLINVNGGVSEWISQIRTQAAPFTRLTRMLASGAVEIGYFGYNEPVETKWPQIDFRRANSPDLRWAARTRALELFLSEYKAPVSGEPDPDRSGGLKRTREVFPHIAMVGGVARELGGDPELASILRRWNVNAVLPGLPELTHFIARNMNGYRGALAGFGVLMSPEPEYAPQLYWQDGFLRLSDAAAVDQGLLRTADGMDAFRKRLAGLKRSNLQVLRIVLSPHLYHLKPTADRDILESPVRWAFRNPKPAAVEHELYLARDQVDAHYARQEAILEYLCEEWLASNAPSRFVSSAALLAAAQATMPHATSRKEVAEAAADVLRRWGTNNHPPAYAKSGGHYYSLAELFDLFSAALEKPAAELQTRHLAGVDNMPDGQGPAVGRVTREQVAEAARRVSRQFDLPAADQAVGEPRIPGWIRVGELQINAAQFLFLMAESLAEPRDSFAIRTCQMDHAPGIVLPSTRPRPDRGTTWTLKPAELRMPVRSAVAAN